MQARVKYRVWTKVQWDGNRSLGFECWQKSFGRGHVSVGVGDFHLIVYSYGPNSDDSYCSTRNRGDVTWTEAQAMEQVDAHRGHGP
jgi:hypothetical protein